MEERGSVNHLECFVPCLLGVYLGGITEVWKRCIWSMIKCTLIIYLEKTEDISFTRKLLLEMYDIGIVFIVLVYTSYQTEYIIWSSGSNYLKYFGFQCDWYSNCILLRFYLMCPYCLTKIGFNGKHLEKTTLVIFTVQKAGLTLLGRTKSIAENGWQRLQQPLPAVDGENLPLSKEEHSFILVLNLRFFYSLVAWLAVRPIILEVNR